MKKITTFTILCMAIIPALLVGFLGAVGALVFNWGAEGFLLMAAKGFALFGGATYVLVSLGGMVWMNSYLKPPKYMHKQFEHNE